LAASQGQASKNRAAPRRPQTRLAPATQHGAPASARLPGAERRFCGRRPSSPLSARAGPPARAGAARRLRRLLQAPAAAPSGAPTWQAVFLITAAPVDVPAIAQSVRARTLPGKFEHELAASGAAARF